jgi:hypothetical protein
MFSAITMLAAIQAMPSEISESSCWQVEKPMPSMNT